MPKQPEPFAGCPPFLRWQLQKDLRFVNKGREVQDKQAKEIWKTQSEITLLRREFPHLGRVKTSLLFQLLRQYGVNCVTDVAAHNLTAFHFVRAINRIGT